MTTIKFNKPNYQGEFLGVGEDKGDLQKAHKGDIFSILPEKKKSGGSLSNYNPYNTLTNI